MQPLWASEKTASNCQFPPTPVASKWLLKLLEVSKRHLEVQEEDFQKIRSPEATLWPMEPGHSLHEPQNSSGHDWCKALVLFEAPRTPELCIIWFNAQFRIQVQKQNHHG